MTFSNRISDVLDPNRVLVLETSKKSDALKLLIDCLATAPQVNDRQELHDGIFYREELMSTGIGLGIGVPHVRLNSIENPVMCVGLCRNPVTDYESLDGQPVRLIFMIAAGKNQHAEHIKLLAKISSKLKDDKLREALINAPDETTFQEIFTQKGN
jgi:PTS system nitrogen regulatory IIA component